VIDTFLVPGFNQSIHDGLGHAQHKSSNGNWRDICHSWSKIDNFRAADGPRATTLSCTKDIATGFVNNVFVELTDYIKCNTFCCKYQWKKCSERRKHCVLAVVRRRQKILPRSRPPSRGCGTAKI